MPLTLSWQEVALRLGLAVAAGGLIGLDRGEHGRQAGFRTTLLVCLAAAVAMIQVNLLLALQGRPSNSFVMLDLMRLPLGILTGVGFIGAGAILRRDNVVIGVTTAATLWFVTVIGLCFGGGQIGLGIAAFALGMVVLLGLRWVDSYLKQEQHATLNVTTERDEPKQEDIRATAQKAGYKVRLEAVAYVRQSEHQKLEFRLQWRGLRQRTELPPFVTELINDPRVLAAEWKVV